MGALELRSAKLRLDRQEPSRSADLLVGQDEGAGEWIPRPFAGEVSSVSYLPRPVKPTSCGLPIALSVMASVPVCVPLTVGVKVTLTAQLLPAANVLPQVLLALTYGPVTAMLEMVAATLLVLVSVTV